MNQSANHQKLLDEILFAFGSRPDVRLWQRSVGVGKSFSGNVLSFGIKGEADLQGLIAPNGRALAIEIKTGTGTLSKDQLRWRTMFEKFGGLYILVTCRALDFDQSVKQALEQFELLK